MLLSLGNSGYLLSQSYFRRNQEYFILATCTFTNVESHSCKLLLFQVSLQQTAFFVFLSCLLMWLKSAQLFPQHLVRASSLSASVVVCGLEQVTVKCKMLSQSPHHGGEQGVLAQDCRADPGMGQDLCSWSIRVCCSSCGALGQSLTESSCSLPGARCGDRAWLSPCHHVWHSQGEPPGHPHLPRHRAEP